MVGTHQSTESIPSYSWCLEYWFNSIKCNFISSSTCKNLSVPNSKWNI